VTYKARVDLLRVTLDAHPLLKKSSRLTAITGEANRIVHAGRLSTEQGWLLTVLHTTRTLDTTLNVLCDSKGWTDPSRRSLGGYLHIIGSKLPHLQAACTGYQSSIVQPRNKYMHTAGAQPQNREADQILTEMQTCLVLLSTQVR